MKRANSSVITGILLVASVFDNRTAHAQGGIPNCASLPNPIYMVGTTAVEPLVRRFGAKLNQLAVKQTLLWNQNTDGCSSVSTMAFEGSSWVNTSTFNYYQEVPADGGTKIATLSCNATINGIGDLAINDIFWTSCFQSYGGGAASFQSLPAGFKEFAGPVQGLVPIVPSTYYYYNDITAEELLDVFVCGANGKILTFTNNSSILDYNCITSGMRELWANSLGVRGSAFTVQIGLGCQNGLTATSVMEAVATTGALDSTLGYTSTEVYDDNRDNVRPLKVSRC
jgi:hypothetical protein